MLRQILYLARNGVPWNEILAMSAGRRLACVITLGELDGGIWDWQALRWQED